MLTRDENELLTRVGAGTAMGALMRQYWIPVVRSDELDAGGKVKRVRLLGEFCAHRGASLFFARNERAGLRCVYHGWQYAPDGQCVDMPNEPLGSRFAEKVCQRGYPCAERGGVVWTYMGPDAPPPPPDLEWTQVPEAHRFVSKFYQECNYLQGLEGGVDPAHISFLHGVLDAEDAEVQRDLDQASAGFALAAKLARAPRLDVVDMPYGALIAAQRDAADGLCYWRITQFHMPFHTMPPTDPKPDPVMHMHIWVPVDDANLVNWCISWHPSRALTRDEVVAFHNGSSIHVMDYAPATSEAYGDIRPAQHKRNDYLVDWEAQRTRKFFGVPGVGAQDKAITESQGAVFDRSRERLGRADSGIIRVRKCLMDAVVALRDRGTRPPGMDAASFAIRPASVLLPRDTPWLDGARDHLVVPGAVVAG